MSGAGFAGMLNERVVPERWIAAGDDLGGDPGQWMAQDALWARIIPENSRPATKGDALSTRRRFRVEMRDVPEMGLHHRLIWRGSALTLLAVARDPRWPDRMILTAEMRT